MNIGNLQQKLDEWVSNDTNSVPHINAVVNSLHDDYVTLKAYGDVIIEAFSHPGFSVSKMDICGGSVLHEAERILSSPTSSSLSRKKARLIIGTHNDLSTMSNCSSSTGSLDMPKQKRKQ